MLKLQNISNQLFAAAASLAVSAFFLAVAIAPANQGTILPGVMA